MRELRQHERLQLMVTRLAVGDGSIRVRRVRTDAYAIAAAGLGGVLFLVLQLFRGAFGPLFALLPLLLALAAFWLGLDTLRRQGSEEVEVDLVQREMRARQGRRPEGRLPFGEIDCLDITRGSFQNLVAVQGRHTVVLFESFVFGPRIMKFAALLQEAGVAVSPRLDFLLKRRGKARRMALLMILFLWLSATLMWLVLRAR